MKFLAMQSYKTMLVNYQFCFRTPEIHSPYRSVAVVVAVVNPSYKQSCFHSNH